MKKTFQNTIDGIKSKAMKFFFIALTLLINVSCVDDSYSQLVNNNSLLDTEQVWLKPNLLILMEGQSNAGTDVSPGSEATGQTPYSFMPTYLRTPPANVYWVKNVANVQTKTAYTVNVSAGWGYLDQILHNVAPRYTQVMFAKTALGGTTILTHALGGGTFNSERANFLSKSGAAIAIANSTWGKGNYNIVIINDHCESNGLSQSDADNFQAGEVEWWGEIRAVADTYILAKRFGLYQDLDFEWGVPNVVASSEGAVGTVTRSFLISGYSTGKFELGDTTGLNDWSHYNKAGCIAVGNAFSKKIFQLFKTTSVDNTAPTISSAVINSGAPNQIVLTYSEALNGHIRPFWKDFTVTGSVTGSRIVTLVTFTGSTCTLTMSENFYTSETVSLTYTKHQWFDSSIQDFFGNEADDLSGYTVTNNSATNAPSSFTLVYSSNFSAGVDGFAAIASGTLASVDGIGGLDDVLEATAGSTQLVFYKNGSFANTTQIHRVRYKLWVPVNFNSASPSNTYYALLTTAIGGLYKSDYYRHLRRNVLGGQWVDLEFTATPTTAGAVRWEFGNSTIGDKVYIRDVRVHRFVP